MLAYGAAGKRSKFCYESSIKACNAKSRPVGQAGNAMLQGRFAEFCTLVASCSNIGMDFTAPEGGTYLSVVGSGPIWQPG
jgi:hypothetical protein